MRKNTYSQRGHAGKKVIIGLLIAIAIALLGAVIITSLVMAGRLKEQIVNTAAVVLLFGATVMGSAIAAAGEKGFWIPLVSYLAIEYLILVIANIMAFGGGLERLGICSIAIIIGAAVAVGLKFLPVAMPRKNKIKYRFR